MTNLTHSLNQPKKKSNYEKKEHNRKIIQCKMNHPLIFFFLFFFFSTQIEKTTTNLENITKHKRWQESSNVQKIRRGKILALNKTLQQRLQKSRSYNTNKELMENDSNRKSLERGRGWGGGGEGVRKVVNERVSFSQAPWCEPGRQHLQTDLTHPATSRGFHAGRRLQSEGAEKILCSATIRPLDCRACPYGPRSLTPTSWWSAFLKGQRLPCRWALGESM